MLDSLADLLADPETAVIFTGPDEVEITSPARREISATADLIASSLLIVLELSPRTIIRLIGA